MKNTLRDGGEGGSPVQTLQVRRGDMLVGFRKVHVREDPECRLHGQVGMCNRPGPGLPPRVPEPSPTPTTAANPPEVTLDHKTAFVTAGGLHLLYDPEALDKWIAKRMELCEEGGHMDTHTGEKLSEKDEAEYALYQKRLCERYGVGEMADRLVKIVDRYMPKVADENRAYVMPYPGNVKTMLQKAWGLRKRIRRRANKSQRQTTGRRGQASASGGADNAAQQRAEEVEESRDMEGERPAMREKRERSVSEARHRDWGDGDSPLGCPASTDDDDGDDDTQFSQWPWGPGGRPSDNDGAAGRLAEKPNEPAAEPPTKKARVNTATERPREPEGEPQAHMASQRGSATSSRPDVK